jgi:predicted alpha/beta-fold hydrolase
MTDSSFTTSADRAVPSFVPRPGLSNGHVMTVVAWVRRRQFPSLPQPDTRLIRVSNDTEVMARCYWQPDRSNRHTLVALHGLEGSSDVHYMRGLADKAWRAGWNAVLVNQRNCGGTEHLTPGLYHSGLTADPRAVINSLATSDRLQRFGVVGYSLGGNLAMKLAGELSTSPAPVAAVVAVCPTIDLERCVRAIERPANLPYQFNFVRNLKARMRRKARTWPDAFDLSRLGSIWTIRKFDDIYTAPHHGFGDASTYYERASALRVIDRIAVPALILAAADDPFVPSEQFEDAALRSNPFVQVHVARHGGHCAFLSQVGEAEYWAERTAMDFLLAVMPATHRAP